MRVDNYHTGLLYAAYGSNLYDAVARRGRYDGLGGYFGRARPAAGFSYVEVAGKKADVVIANPSGIQCDGCGVINAGRTTLTKSCWNLYCVPASASTLPTVFRLALFC